MQLHELLEQVTDAASFLAFAQALAADRRAAPDSWENPSLPEFLEAALSWAEDSDFGLTQGLSPGNPWRQFAVFLYCGKIYE